MKHAAELLVCLLLAIPAMAQRGGGMHGGGGHASVGHAGASHIGMGRGFAGGGFHSGGFIGSGFGHRGYGGFRSGLYFRHNGFFNRRFFYNRFGFGFWPYVYPWYGGFGWPDYYSYPSDYSYPYDNGYQQAPEVIVYAPEPAPPVVYEPPVRPEIREYGGGGEGAPPQPAAGASRYEAPIYLIAFKNQDIIRAAQAYWVEGDKLHYVTLQHEQKQAPLDTVDRAFSSRLNRERRVDFRLPPEQ